MSKERLLRDYESEENSPKDARTAGLSSWLPKTNLVLWVALVCLSASNIIFYRQSLGRLTDRDADRSKYSGLTYDTPMMYKKHTEYLDPNETIADYHWDAIDTSPMIVALTDEWAADHDLPRSVFRFPWDEENKGIYYLKAYHGLHCLKAMRKAFVQHERDLPRTIPSWHVHHCLDVLRQDIMCTADDTPMAGVALPHNVGEGQVSMCRNWDKLVEWSQHRERNACYHRITDYGGVKRPVEMYGNCPEDSEYRPVMEAYFEKWGHKDPFEAPEQTGDISSG